MNPPEEWDIVSTFQKSESIGDFRIISERPKQALFGAVIGLGKFTEYTQLMGQTVVKIYVNEGYSPHESEIAKTAFSIYQSTIDLFGAKTEQYTFIFTPVDRESSNVMDSIKQYGYRGFIDDAYNGNTVVGCN